MKMNFNFKSTRPKRRHWARFGGAWPASNSRLPGRDPGNYGPRYDNLELEDLSCSPLQAYLQESYDDGYAEGESVDVTSNDQSVCEAANGTWANGSCEAAFSAGYNCWVGGFCSQVASGDPDSQYGFWASIDGVTNAYDGHTADAGLAKDAGCDVADGQTDWNAGQEKASISAGYSYHVYGLSLALICK